MPSGTKGDSQVLDTAGLPGQYFTQAFDPGTCQVDLFPVSSFTRHVPPAAMYRLETACGRAATLTGDHNLFVLRDGHLQLIETADARPSDLIPLPESLLSTAAPVNDEAATPELDERGRCGAQPRAVGRRHASGPLASSRGRRLR